MEEVRVWRSFEQILRADFILVYFVLFTSFCVLPSLPLSFFSCTGFFIFPPLCSSNLSNVLLPLCPYVFVLILYHFDSHLPFVSLTSFSPSEHLSSCIFLSRTLLPSLTPPPSYSHVRSDIHLHTCMPSSLLPLTPASGCTCVPGFGPDMARVAAEESGKCWSPLIRRYYGRHHPDGQDKRNTHTHIHTGRCSFLMFLISV